MRKITLAFLMIIFCVAHHNLFADVVYLKDGTIVEGKYISDTATGMYFEVEKEGQVETVKFLYDDIETVDFTTTSDATKKARQKKKALAKKAKREQERVEKEAEKEVVLEGIDIGGEDVSMEELVEQARALAEGLGLAQKSEE